MQNFEITATNNKYNESHTVAIVKAKDKSTAIEKFCKARKKDGEPSDLVTIADNWWWFRGVEEIEYNICIFHGYNL